MVEQGTLYPTDGPFKTVWRESAACQGMDPALWFGDTAEQEQEAKRVCSSCPVQPACLDANLAERVGIFGGLNERERNNLRRRRRAAQVRRVA